MIYTADGILSRILTVSDYKEVYNQLYSRRIKWRPIGVCLGLSPDDLDDENRRNEQWLEKMILDWLRQRTLNPTWQSVIDALRHHTVRLEGAAEYIRKYLLYSEAAG